MSLAKILDELHNSDQYPLHMPGHKRDYSPEKLLSGAYSLDITEIEGYDNLYDAQGILREAMDRAGKLYRCPNTYFLVNGSTTGVITAIYAVTNQGDHIIIASNCHRSVYSTIELRELTADYMEPDKLLCDDIYGGIKPESVKKTIEESIEKGIRPAAVVITSPNYDGIISDIEGIVKAAHGYKVPVIVDEAHGAHLSLHKDLPKGAIEAGADIVIHSTHKTLAAMTQTALLHVQGDLVDITKVEKYWHTFQTSSPSYVLMASIDAAVNDLLDNGDKLWKEFLLNRSNFYDETKGLESLHILTEGDIRDRADIAALDPCKITVIPDGCIDGIMLQRILLDDYHIQLELASAGRIIAIVTYGDTADGFRRLTSALKEIDEKIKKGELKTSEVTTQAAAASGENRNLYAPCIPGQVQSGN